MVERKWPTRDFEKLTWVRFRARIALRGANPYVLVNAERAGKVRSGWRRAMPVRVRVNGKPAETWRINMMPVGNGEFYLYLHETVRKASGTKVGDTVAVEVCFDAGYRNGPTHGTPGWFARALDGNAGAKKAWGALPPSRHKEVLRYFAGLKSEEARERNLEKVMRALSGEEVRFMARTWHEGK